MSDAQDKLPIIETFGCSQTGRGRTANTDDYVVAELNRAARVTHASIDVLDDSRRFGDRQAQVMLVADGVDQPLGAERASRIVVNQVLENVLNAVPWTPGMDLAAETDLRRTLEQTVERANEELCEVRSRGPGAAPSATMTLAFVVHAGDSRAYRLRSGEIKRLTRDHTFAQQMVETGDLEEDEAAVSKFAGMLWNAVGGDDAVVPELTVERLEHGDQLLLCTDGLTAHLNDGAIQHLIASSPDVRSACNSLVGTIAGVGGSDDCTVALARFGEPAETMSERESGDAVEPSGQLGAAAKRPEPEAEARPPQLAVGKARSDVA